MNINEIKEKYAINTADEAIEMIVGLGYDYDGFSNENDLKSLIDELVELAVLAKSLMHVPANEICTNRNMEHKFLIAEQVRNFTPAEVRENYKDILLSMPKWEKENEEED